MCTAISTTPWWRVTRPCDQQSKEGPDEGVGWLVECPARRMVTPELSIKYRASKSTITHIRIVPIVPGNVDLACKRKHKKAI